MYRLHVLICTIGANLFALLALLLLTLPLELTFPFCYLCDPFGRTVISAVSHVSLLDYFVSSDCCITIEMVSARSVVVGVLGLPKRDPSQGFRTIRADLHIGLCIIPI